MLKRTLVCVALLAGIANAQSVSQVPELPLKDKAFSRVSLAMVCGSQMSAGSGTLVAGDIVLTATHVLSEPGVECKGVVITEEGRGYRIAEWKTVALDVAVARLEVATPVRPYPEVALDFALSLGDELCAVTAYPVKDIVCGTLLGSYVFKVHGSTTIALETSIRIEPGNSGSPVYYKGVIIGVVSALRLDRKTAIIAPLDGNRCPRCPQL